MHICKGGDRNEGGDRNPPQPLEQVPVRTCHCAIVSQQSKKIYDQIYSIYETSHGVEQKGEIIEFFSHFPADF